VDNHLDAMRSTAPSCVKPVERIVRRTCEPGGHGFIILSMPADDLPDVEQVVVDAVSPDRLLTVAEPSAVEDIRRAIAVAGETFAGHTIWNVNSTAKGGGVAELLQSLVPYARGAGVDARWAVISGDDGFFHITKRIHNRLHGDAGDGGPLGPEERRHYEAVSRANASRLLRLVKPADLVLLHDPQTAGIVSSLRAAGITVVWRCHVGVLEPNDTVRSAWDFLRPFVRDARAYVFSSKAFVWDGLDTERVVIIAPSIDPFSPKNRDLDGRSVAAILDAAGLVDDPAAPRPARYPRADGTEAEISNPSSVTEGRRLGADTPVVLQVSRWDRLKDPEGVMRGFVEYVAPRCTADLMLAGPSVAQVTDDPEGFTTCEEVQAAWRRLPPQLRARVHLATLSMNDVEENAVVVNALQRHARVVVQKSLAEGFGLTVAEAMWKAKPVVASRVGGIPDQIDDGVSGCLVEPRDLAGFGDRVAWLLTNPAEAGRMGRAAEQRIRAGFLGSRQLLQYLDLFRTLRRR
jgi:trehalose synthase